MTRLLAVARGFDRAETVTSSISSAEIRQETTWLLSSTKLSLWRLQQRHLGVSPRRFQLRRPRWALLKLYFVVHADSLQYHLFAELCVLIEYLGSRVFEKRIFLCSMASCVLLTQKPLEHFDRLVVAAVLPAVERLLMLNPFLVFLSLLSLHKFVALRISSVSLRLIDDHNAGLLVLAAFSDLLQILVKNAHLSPNHNVEAVKLVLCLVHSFTRPESFNLESLRELHLVHFGKRLDLVCKPHAFQ